MVEIRAATVVWAVAVVCVCSVANGFTPSTAVVPSSRKSTTTLLLEQPQQRRPQRSRSTDVLALQAVGSGADDGIEEYKKQMADFMAQAHEKRLEAMEAVKAEVQRGYEEQIADLQSKLAALPASDGAALRVEEPQLVGAGAAASSGPAGSAVGIGSTTQHPSYAARSARPGWEARWGSEETSRVSSPAAATAASATPSSAAHPAYIARAKRPGWEARWGNEEVARIEETPGAGVTGASATAAATAAVTAAASPDAGTSHPAYAARVQRPGWEARWGTEEAARAGGGGTPLPAAPGGVQGEVHPAYAARAQRPGWEARWGDEEPARVTSVATATSAATSAAEPVSTPPPIETTPADVHPAYAARSRRAGWESRWGAEEKDRVAGAAAGAIAAAGAAAGFATAGGLDAEDATEASTADTTAPKAAASVMSGMGKSDAADPLVDEFMPDDVDELQSMVVSNRRHFQEYLLKSLEAGNEIKQSKAKLEAELSSSSAKLAAEEQLRESLQESFLEYMSRSGDASATGKARIAELEKETASLTARAEELQRYTQEYMVKASNEKQKAIEAATANARAESAERISALQAQVLELQASG